MVLFSKAVLLAATAIVCFAYQASRGRLTYLLNMPRTPRATSRVRFNLPLTRQNTIYSDTSSISHIHNLTEEEIDKSDEELVAKWLMTDGTPPSRPYRMHASELEDPNPASTSTSGIPPGPLGLQLLHSGLTMLGKIPPDDVPPPVPRAEPQPLPKLKKRARSDFTHPDGTPLSFHYSKAFFNDDEQEYIIPSHPSPFSNQEQPEIRISVTKDWSRRKLSKHREDQLLIYRVPCEHQVFFGMTASEYGLSGITLRRPEDELDAVRVTRHGHISWDTGTKDEVWYVIAKDPHVVRHVSGRVAQIKPSVYTKMKRMFWRNFGFRRSPPLHDILA